MKKTGKELLEEAMEIEEDEEEDDEIEMSKDEFIKEHERLIKILRNGNDAELKAEADKQEKELSKYK